MKKFLNRAEQFVPEMLEGILAAHPRQLTHVADDLHCIVKAGPRKPNKVGLATGGGSGHLPLFLGYVGTGMLDGCAVGDVVLFRRVHQILTERGIAIVDTRIGEFATSMEMAGASLSLLRLDDELKRLLCKPALTPFFEQGQL